MGWACIVPAASSTDAFIPPPPQSMASVIGSSGFSARAGVGSLMDSTVALLLG